MGSSLSGRSRPKTTGTLGPLKTNSISSRASRTPTRSIVGAISGTGSSTQDSENAGSMVEGTERFIRGNRVAGDFVGADSGDKPGFVGAQQAEGEVEIQTAQEDLQIEQAPDANQGQVRTAPPRTGMYNPRLAVSFRFNRRPAAVRSSSLARLLASSHGLRLTSPIEVSVEGETATLRGEVASERDRTLARLLLLFEPGISEVRNELQVSSPGQPRPGTATASPLRRSQPLSGPREF